MYSMAPSANQSPKGISDFVGGLSGFGVDEVYEPRREVKRSMSGDMQRAMEMLEYSEVDLELLADDDRQFAVLKQSLRNKGAVTNEVLKQKLPLYLKFKKDRFARSNPEAAAAMRSLPRRSLSSGRVKRTMTDAERASAAKPVNRVLSDYEKSQAEGSLLPQQGMLGRILRPHRTTSNNFGGRPAMPQRTTSNNLAGRPVTPVRTKSTNVPSRPAMLVRTFSNDF